MKGSKKSIGSRVKAPDGSLGTVVGYDEKTDSYDVELDSGKMKRYRSTELKVRSSAGRGRGGCLGVEGGGADDWK